jgi:hypothetical protein
MIRLAPEKEAIEILNEPQNVGRIGLVSEHIKYQPWIAEDGRYRMMFVFWHVEDKTFEVHIAAPNDSRIKSRELTKEIMNWIFKHGASRIITNCPKGKISNLAIKLGMTAYKTEGETIYFEALSWL